MPRLHISGLGPDPDRKKVEREFEFYGELMEVWLSKRHSGHALIEFNTTSDAEDAVKGMHGRKIDGYTIRVIWAKRGPERELPSYARSGVKEDQISMELELSMELNIISGVEYSADKDIQKKTSGSRKKQKVKNNEPDPLRKPKISIPAMIAMAIEASDSKSLLLGDIYKFFTDKYPYYKLEDQGWQNSIRHNLSLNDCFMKCGRPESGKGHYWTVRPDSIEEFQNGGCRRRIMKRKCTPTGGGSLSMLSLLKDKEGSEEMDDSRINSKDGTITLEGLKEEQSSMELELSTELDTILAEAERSSDLDIAIVSHYDPDYSRKPTISYPAMIAMAILDSQSKRVLLGDIYTFIMDKFPYYRLEDHYWRNAIRHNLSLNVCFMKAGRADSDSRQYWTIRPDRIKEFQSDGYRGKLRRTCTRAGSTSMLPLSRDFVLQSAAGVQPQISLLKEKRCRSLSPPIHTSHEIPTQELGDTDRGSSNDKLVTVGGVKDDQLSVELEGILANVEHSSDQDIANMSGNDSSDKDIQKKTRSSRRKQGVKNSGPDLLRKPTISYPAMIAMAILNSESKSLLLGDIYKFIMDKYPYYSHRLEDQGWRNSIRHNLSLNVCFMKCGRPESGKGHYWTLRADSIKEFQDGGCRRRRKTSKGYTNSNSSINGSIGGTLSD